jgi:uncharacterized membrane protein
MSKSHKITMQDINDVRGYYAIGFAVIIPSLFCAYFAYEHESEVWGNLFIMITAFALGMIAVAKHKETQVMKNKLPKQFDQKTSTRIKINVIIGTTLMPIVFLIMIFGTGTTLGLIEIYAQISIHSSPDILQRAILGMSTEILSIIIAYMVGMRYCGIAIDAASKEHFDIFGEKDVYPLRFFSGRNKENKKKKN